MSQLPLQLLPKTLGLNEQQTAAYLCDDNAMILAGAGSGKTRVLASKLSRHIFQHGEKMAMGVTFTRNSASELKERVIHTLCVENLNPLVSTLHSACLRQVKKIYPNYRLLSGREAQDRLQIIAYKLGIELHDNKIISLDFCIRNNLPLPPDLSDYAEIGKELHNAYKTQLHKERTYDTDLIIPMCNKAYSSGRAEPLPIKFLLIDEWQDVDQNQIDWMMFHANQGTKISVVGDDDQSIYSFRASRGADAFRQMDIGTSPQKFFLSINYRCAKKVVDRAVHVVSRNSDRISKEIIAASSEEGIVMSLSFDDLDIEAYEVCNKFLQICTTTKSPSFAVLSRTNQSLFVIEAIAKSLNIKTKIHDSGSGFLSKPVIQQALSALQFGLEPHNHTALLIALKAAGISRESMQVLADVIHKCTSAEEIMEAMYSVDTLNNLIQQDHTLFIEFRKTMASWVWVCEEDGEPVDEKGEKLSDELCTALRNLSNYFVGENKPASAQEFIQILYSIITKRLKGNIENRLKYLLSDDSEKDKDEAEAESSNEQVMHLMTVHASKGLEYDHVWIIGVNNNVFPSANSDKEEERRLLYVAMTRAKIELIISGIHTYADVAKQLKLPAQIGIKIRNKKNSVGDFMFEIGLPVRMQSEYPSMINNSLPNGV